MTNYAYDASSNINWFVDNLPYEISHRHDGKTNVWKMTKVIDEDGESDLKWQTVAVFYTDEEAKLFISQQTKA